MSRHRGARQWDGTAESATAIIDWILAAGGTARYHDDPAELSIDVPDGTVTASPGMWVARESDGTFSARAFQSPDEAQSGAKPLTVYVSIGNSDDKLTQQRWNQFCNATRRAVFAYASQVYGDWASASGSRWQNACVGFRIPMLAAATLRCELGKIAAEFGQDSIAWAEAVTEFISPESETLSE